MRPVVLYVATTNAGKLRDFAAAANAFSIAIEPLPGLRAIKEPVEDGATFEANARLKAEHYSRHAPGLWVLADDSGLEVDALNGAPGVRSARFAQDEKFAGNPEMTTDERNNACLLERLRRAATETPGLKPLSSSQLFRGMNAPASTDTPLSVRVPHPTGASQPVGPALSSPKGWGPPVSARYDCVLALARDGQVELTAEGSVEGVILEAPRGNGGFGYDPLFFIPELNATMAEINLQTKQQISHRGKALCALLQELNHAALLS